MEDMVFPSVKNYPLDGLFIGDVCLGKAHKPEVVDVYKTSVLSNGRNSFLVPCENEFSVKEFSSDIFKRLACDEQPALSIEDKRFLHIMESNFHRSNDGFWEAQFHSVMFDSLYQIIDLWLCVEPNPLMSTCILVQSRESMYWT